MLACAEGRPNIAVAARLGVSRGTVTRWRARFLARRLDGLSDEPRPGVPRTISDAQVEEVVVRTLEEVPEGATHWSKRELVVGLYLAPPANAAVFAVDEKPQIQALERTAPVLPMLPGTRAAQP